VKYLFLFSFFALILASLATWYSAPELQSEVPVIYWVTDSNPARKEQIEIFHRWLKKHGHPEMELRLDVANRDVSKMIIQGVSGVGGDAMDIGSGAGLRYFQAVGLLKDVTDWGRELGFDPSRTYAAMEPEITLGGRQYMFPCNVYLHLYWVNRATFRQYGQPQPPERWDFAEFERRGKAFVKAANPPDRHRTVFFANQIPTTVMHRSVGLSVFDEALTRCALDDPRYVEVLQRKRKWTYEDRILPSRADIESFATESGYGGSTLQLFNSGNYAMFLMGRYALIQLREFGNLELAVSHPPYGKFPNTSIGTRAAAIYTGSPHQQLAKYFLTFLASEDYNMQIVRDADALPPNPRYTETTAFKYPLPLLPANLEQIMGYREEEMEGFYDFKIRFYEALDGIDRRQSLDLKALPSPPRPGALREAEYQKKLAEFRDQYTSMLPTYRNEWGCHEIFVQAAETIAIGGSYSPFVLPSTVSRISTEVEDGFMAGIYSAEEAARTMAARIDGEIQRTLEENPRLKPLYEKYRKDQEEIDRLRQRGEPVPRRLIRNPFHRRYFAFKGWIK
jgi:multiple sugar transport system substrate-binding protein